jgi:hypothetical protein
MTGATLTLLLAGGAFLMMAVTLIVLLRGRAPTPKPRRNMRALITFTAEEQRALMTWGLLGGVVALTVAQAAIILLLHAHWTEDRAEQLIGGLFWHLGFLTALQALFGFGLVAIARGGSMTLSVSRDGATITSEATGSAARELATGTNLGAQG